MQETLHKHSVSNESNKDNEDLENEITEKTVQKDENLFLNWPLMSSIIVYCVFSLHDIIYSEVCFTLYIRTNNLMYFIYYVCYMVGLALLALVLSLPRRPQHATLLVTPGYDSLSSRANRQGAHEGEAAAMEGAGAGAGAPSAERGMSRYVRLHRARRRHHDVEGFV